MTGTGGTAEFEALARRMWNVWSEAFAPAPATPAEEGMRAWRDGMAWWSRLAQGQGGPAVDASLGRFGGQAQQWFAQMQQLASGFAGQQPTATQVVDAWKRMLGGATANPLSDLLSAMQGQGLQDPSRWMASLKPLFDLQSMQASFDPGALSGVFAGVRAEGGDALSMPTFGVAREHQARWQALARAQAEHQAAMAAYHQLLQQSTQAAFGHFERRLAKRGEQGQPVETARALFDLWIDAAEDAYAELALSREFRAAYADLVNSQMRVRAGVQREVEEACASLGMPTRRELDGAHRKAADLERTVRGLRDAVAALQAGAGTSARGGAEDAAPVSRKPTGARAKARREAAVESRLRAARGTAPAAAAGVSDGSAPRDPDIAKVAKPGKAAKPDKRPKRAKAEAKRSKSAEKLGRSKASESSGNTAMAGAQAPSKRSKSGRKKRSKDVGSAADAKRPKAPAPRRTRKATPPTSRPKRAAALVAQPARRSAPALNPFAAIASIPDAPQPLAGKAGRKSAKETADMSSPIAITPASLAEEAATLQQKLGAGLTTLRDLGDTSYGATPKEEVWRDGRVVLYRFIGDRAPTARVPLLICYALVNRPYMVDLQADRSLVRNLLARGEDVYVIDWGYADRSDRFLTLEDYIERFLGGAVDHLRHAFGIDAVNLLGICQGGAFSLCYASLHPAKVRNLITMVTPVDFHTPDNMLSNWTRGLDVDLFVDTLGNVPADMMNFCYLTLKPWRLFAQKYVGLVDILDDRKALEDFVRMETWIFDSPDQAGEAFRQFIRDFYQRNGFVEGGIRIGEREVHLEMVEMPVLNIYAEQDHLVPPDASRRLAELVGTEDYSELSFRGGHIGIYVSGRAQKEVPTAIHDWLAARDGRRRAA